MTRIRWKNVAINMNEVNCTILFKQFLLKQIALGQKTETRRLWEKPRVKAGQTYWACHKYYMRAPDCKITVVNLHQEKLREITPEGVKREGFPDGNIEAFIAGFYLMHEKKANISVLNFCPGSELLHEIPLEYNPVVWVIEFKLVSGSLGAELQAWINRQN